jgi:2,4-dienoyl-CoA reductase-like NADH-dependent reductase (Old Yellow Enzyme family)
VDVIDCSSGGLTGSATNQARPGYSYQVPYAKRLRGEGGVKTMAVGLIVHADQAEGILQSGRCRPGAIGREILDNPNWPTDAARKLG